MVMVLMASECQRALGASMSQPMFVMHGDSDLVVPYDGNTRVLKERYEAGGGQITVKLIPGEGHKVSPSYFECKELVDFVITNATK